MKEWQRAENVPYSMQKGQIQGEELSKVSIADDTPAMPCMEGGKASPTSVQRLLCI